MADKEKVIKGLECCIKESNDTYCPCNDCPYQGEECFNAIMKKDALVLLKRQHEIILCKDCKWYSEKGFCKHPNGGAGNIKPSDWYCGDGEREDD